jgi:hypothetical protein
MKKIFVIGIAFLLGCGPKGAKMEVLSPFGDICPQQLLDYGFERVMGVDAYMFGKSESDTATYYFFEDSNAVRPYAQSWEISYDSIGFDQLSKFLSIKKCFILDTIPNSRRHYIFNSERNAIMVGLLLEQEKKLKVSYDFILPK